MSIRQEVTQRLIIDGQPRIIRLIQNPTIDDVLVSEARIHAAEIEQGIQDDTRRVPRAIRDFLIRMKVER
jgi:hypothetical protein